MSLSENIQRINREISATVERALSDLRQEVSQRLRASQDEVLRRLDEITPELPAAFLADQELIPIAEQMTAEARDEGRAAGLHDGRAGGFREVRDALAAIDHARSQAEVLAALLREASRFASRAAVLLLHDNGFRGWGGQGFGDAEPAIRELTFTPAAGSAWSQLAQGGSTLRLGAPDCAALCSRIEAPLPHDGLLVPLVLRDRVAAGLYADRMNGEIAVEALQVLCFAAGQAIELFPFRERPSTPSLSLEGEAAPAPAVPEPAVAEVAEIAAEPPAAAAAVPEAPAPPPPAAVPEPVAALPETAPEPETAPLPAWSAPVAEPPVEAAMAPESATGLASAEEIEVEAEPEAAPWSAFPGATVETEMEMEALPEVEALPEEPAPSWQAPVAPAAPAAVPGERPSSPAATVYQPLPQEAIRAAAEPAAGDRPAAAPTSEATVLLPRPGLREAAPPPLRPVPPPPPEPAATSAPSLGASAEVRPPSDVDGPGWAFATGRVAVAAGEESLHEEARRLARLLVSEIKLYNEEQVEEGRRKRDVYERLKEDIDRSRQMYEERVEPRILKTTDYFYQELVRILAAGDAKALGI